ncbi:hypothetical protein DFH11DRAFT_1725250 [Phellopilus nigrolimitatus]|nr:hypothetical protein DFH11DRAFT_1725250 [Phellopilus nigrolimitatus]
MGDDSEARRLRKEIARLQTYIEEQRRRHSSETKALRKELEDEIKYSDKLRKDLDDEFKHCERLRKELDDKRRLTKDLREDLDDERHYSDQLERKLDKRTRQIEKLEAELLDLEDDYALAYKELKRTDGLRRELEDSKLVRLYAKQRVTQLQEEVRSLRGQDSRSPTPLRAPPPAAPIRTPSPDLGSEYSEQEEADDRLSEGDIEEEEAYSDDDDVDHEDPDVADEEEVKEEDSAPGTKLRNLAAREGRLADREFQRAREAYTSGDKAFAKKLKDTAVQHRDSMKNYHRMAAAEIFNHHNPEYHSKPTSRDRIDLHHLHVNEAIEFVEKHIELCRAGGIRAADLICGRGNHSAGGVAKLRPAILSYLATQRDVVVDTHETNPGRIVVRFADSWKPADDDIQRLGAAKTPSQSSSRGPERAEIADVFEHGRTRLKAATKAAAEVRQGLEEIEQGMSAMKVKSEKRRGLREVTNRNNANE